MENLNATRSLPSLHTTAPIRTGRFINTVLGRPAGVSASPLKPTSLGGTPNAFVAPPRPAWFFRDTTAPARLLLCNSIRFPVVPFHSFIIGDIAYSPRYRAERENSRYNRNFFNDKEKNGGANLRLRSENGGRRRRRGGEGGGRGIGRGEGVAEGKKETGRVSNGRIRIKRKIKVNAFRRPLCRRLVGMNGSIEVIIKALFNGGASSTSIERIWWWEGGGA